MVDSFLVETRHSPIPHFMVISSLFLRKKQQQQQQHIKRKSVVKAMSDALRNSTEILKLFLFTVHSSWIINFFSLLGTGECFLLQRAKKVVSDSAGLVDFAIGPVNCVLNLPNGINSAHPKFWGLVEMMFGLVNASFSLP